MPTPPTPPSCRAITMWDFSWLERRWPGAGYEDWDQALDELAERGYNAVRIDAYPHLLFNDPTGEHELIPPWSVNDWGAPIRSRVQILPALTDFIAACAQRDIRVALSSWYQRDTRDCWRMLCNPNMHARSWIRTLDVIRDAGLLDHILYLDLCNEWPIPNWAPFLYGQEWDAVTGAGPASLTWDDPKALSWSRDTMDHIRQSYPDMPLTFSTQMQGDWSQAAFCDFWEPHIWMVMGGDFNQRAGYSFNHRFDHTEYENLQRRAEPLYRADPEHWQGNLRKVIDEMAEHARTHGKPLITTECWGIVDYKDAPLLDWGWIKELCALGVEHASASGCWIANATSNFCGPQFVGMWRDIEWHQRLTTRIKSSPITVPVPDMLAKRL